MIEQWPVIAIDRKAEIGYLDHLKMMGSFVNWHNGSFIDWFENSVVTGCFNYKQWGSLFYVEFECVRTYFLYSKLSVIILVAFSTLLIENNHSLD